MAPPSPGRRRPGPGQVSNSLTSLLRLSSIGPAPGSVPRTGRLVARLRQLSARRTDSDQRRELGIVADDPGG